MSVKPLTALRRNLPAPREPAETLLVVVLGLYSQPTQPS